MACTGQRSSPRTLQWREIGDYQAALDHAALARSAASRTGRRDLSITADMAMSDVLRGTGRYREAEAIVGAIDEQSLDEHDRAWVLLKKGLLHLDAGNWRLARDPLTRMLREERASRSPRPDLLQSVLQQASDLAGS